MLGAPALPLQALLDALRRISRQPDLEALLVGTVEEARTLARARFAALGVLDDDGDVTRFVTAGDGRPGPSGAGVPPGSDGPLVVPMEVGGSSFAVLYLARSGSAAFSAEDEATVRARRVTCSSARGPGSREARALPTSVAASSHRRRRSLTV